MSSEKLKTIRDPIRLAIAIDDGQTWPGTSLTGGSLAAINRIEDPTGEPVGCTCEWRSFADPEVAMRQSAQSVVGTSSHRGAEMN